MQQIIQIILLLYIGKAFYFGGGRVGRLQAAALNILGSYSESVSHMNSGVYFLNEVWARIVWWPTATNELCFLHRHPKEK